MDCSSLHCHDNYYWGICCGTCYSNWGDSFAKLTTINSDDNTITDRENHQKANDIRPSPQNNIKTKTPVIPTHLPPPRNVRVDDQVLATYIMPTAQVLHLKKLDETAPNTGVIKHIHKDQDRSSEEYNLFMMTSLDTSSLKQLTNQPKDNDGMNDVPSRCTVMGNYRNLLIILFNLILHLSYCY